MSSRTSRFDDLYITLIRTRAILRAIADGLSPDALEAITADRDGGLIEGLSENTVLHLHDLAKAGEWIADEALTEATPGKQRKASRIEMAA